MSLRVLIADDEAPARRKLARFLQAHDGVEIVAEASNGLDAVDLFAHTRPSLVFLDIHMPDLDGMGVAEALVDAGTPPAIVFVTAYDEYALRAFEVRAIDYLLKPFDRERFDRAFVRARDATVPRTDISAALVEARGGKGYPARMLVPADGKSFFVAMNDVVRFESDGNNVIVHTAKGSHAVRATLESIESRVDPERFARIHRSHIVNIDAVASLEPWFHGDFTATLADGTKLPWSRRYAAKRPDLLK